MRCVQKYVAWREVAMNDAARVCMMSSASQRFDHLSGITGNKWTILQSGHQIRAIDELHCQIRSMVDLSNIVNLHDIGMLQPPNRFRLGAETGQLGSAGIVAATQDFERDQTAQSRLSGAIDHTHAASADFCLYDIARHVGQGDGSLALRRSVEFSIDQLLS